MADDRAVETLEEQAARLERELNDFKSTMMNRLNRRPTGDVEATIRTAPKANTLICNGALVLRADYPELWTWANDQGLITGGLFNAGNGSTTFGLPDFRGRVPIGVGTLGADTYAIGALVGASTVALTTAQLASHTHTGSVSGTSSTDSHGHSGNTGGGGDHGGHSNATETTPGGQYGNVAAGAFGGGGHSHGFSTSSDSHSHTLSGTTGAYGSGTPIDNRQPSIVVNWLIWT